MEAALDLIRRAVSPRKDVSDTLYLQYGNEDFDPLADDSFFNTSH